MWGIDTVGLNLVASGMAAREETRNLSPVRILVVDDSQLMRRCLRTVLEQHTPWKVCGEASNGREAVEKAQQANPDVIVLDLQMPVMNGLDAAKEIRRKSPEVPILMVSLHMSSQLADQAKRAGIRGTCDKGNIGCVVEGIDALLHDGTYYRN
jgi:DNA-binding NarL/FixJ family response regulator